MSDHRHSTSPTLINSKDAGMGRLSERGSKVKKHKWTRKEDEALIAALSDLCETGWKRDNNIFRSGYTGVLEKELRSKLPGCNLKASPHIESRLKTLKKHCDAITDMKDAFDIRWNNTEHTVMCDDDDVWEDWVKDHSDAKGLRNKPFPYYDELCIIFGKSRGNQKFVENASDADKALDVDEADDYAGKMLGAKEFNLQNGANVKGVELVSNEPVHEEANNHTGNGLGADGSNDDEVSMDDVDGTQIQMQGGSSSTENANKKRTCSSESCPSGLEGVAKIFGTLLEKHEEKFSLLVRLVGREVAADKAAVEKRSRLNGELKRIPNLSLQARLRAASVLVGDPPKLDLFYSLSNDERKEWVSMLLSGLI